MKNKNETTKAKTVKGKILLTIIPVIVLGMLLLMGLSLKGMQVSTISTLETSMHETATAAATMMQIQLDSYKTLAIQLANEDIFTQELPDVGAENYEEEKNKVLNYLQKTKELHDFGFLQVIDENGIELETGMNFDYEPYVTEMIRSKITGDLLIMIAAPITTNNQFQGCILYAIDPIIFSEYLAEIKVGKNGVSFIVDNQGTIIAHPDTKYVEDKYNPIEEAKKNESIGGLASSVENLLAGNTDFDSYAFGGSDIFATYTPIKHTNGWGIFITAQQGEFLGKTRTTMVFYLIFSAIITLICSLVIGYVASRITKPITLCSLRLEKLAKGDLTSPIPDINTNDELGVLIQSTQTITNTLKTIILDMSGGLGQMAQGNLDIESTAPEYYMGDFEPLKESIYTIINGLTKVLLHIKASAEELTIGATHVANGSQMLSVGASTQSSSIEMLYTTIEDISKEIQDVSAKSQEAWNTADLTSKGIESASKQMNELLTGIKEIDQKSVEINKIIKIIDDIAFQTNILALNAAVEAARAGESGKGFSVVADEVRSLAVKSAQAAKSTAALIEDTVTSIGKSTKIASSTAETLDQYVIKSNDIVVLMNEILEISQSQSEAIEDIKTETGHISSVVMTNAATAQEGAASSEELSSQSFMMNQLIGKFTLKNDPTIDR